MRLLGYYLGHTLVNGIKKLFRTWVGIFLAIVLGFGLIGGIVGYTLGTVLPDDASSYEETEDDATEEESGLPPETVDTLLRLIEVGAGAVILLILLIHIYTADKSGSNFFLMADVNFLFTAPLRPQTVLLFRTILQMGTTLVGSVYLLFQLPNWMNNGMSGSVALAILVCWVMTLIVGKLLAVLTYTLVTCHPALRRYMKPAVFTLAVLVGMSVAAVSYLRHLPLADAAIRLYGAGYSRLFPLWGWLKGIVGYAMEGRLIPALACVIATAAGSAVLIWLTWRMQADFYEDALDHAAQLQQAMEAAKEKRTVQRKKDRADRIKRDGLDRGVGGSMFLHKAVYNRRRFAFLGILTGTGGTYLGIGVVSALLIRLLSDDGGTHLLVIPAAILLGIAFFRNLGNPIEEDMGRPYLMLVPDTAFRKLLSALAAGSYSTLLDVLPALLIAAIILGASPWEALGWLLLIVTMDWMVSCGGLLLHQILPDSLPAQIGATLQLMLKMFGAVPPLIALIAISVGWHLTGATLVVAAFNLIVGVICFLPAQAMYHGGKG